MHHPQAVLKAGVLGPREDVVGAAQLSQAPQHVKLGCLDDGLTEGRRLHGGTDGVGDEPGGLLVLLIQPLWQGKCKDYTDTRQTS